MLDLIEFRERVHACLTVRRDALFGVLDAVCCPVVVESLAHLSLAERHQRRHGSVYAALARGRIDADRLREELVLARDPTWPLVFAVDASTWCRNDAECSAERGYYYHPSHHSNGQPIVAGGSYQWIAQLNWPADSWTQPVDAVRLDPRSEAPGPELDHPQVRTPEQADRWTWLVITAHTQLRLARHLAEDHRLPWQPPLPPDRLTPARGRRGFRNIRPKTALPASAPKPSRPGPGRPPGSKNRRLAPHHDVGKTLKRDTTLTGRQDQKG